MRILVLIGTPRIGGGELLAVESAQAMKERGHYVEVALPEKSPFYNLLKQNGLEVHSVSFMNRHDPVSRYKLAKIMDKGWDIIHSHLSTPSYIAGKLQNSVYKHKLILHSHGLDRGSDFKNAHLIITGSFAAREHLIAQGIDEKRIMVSVNPLPRRSIINVSEFGELSSEVSIIENIKDKTNILCVARLHKNKGQDILVRAFVKMLFQLKMTIKKHRKFNPEDLRLVFVGDGPELYRLKKLAEEYNIEDKVVFAGETLNVDQFYKVSRLFVLPSFRECLPLSLLEAMSNNVPVIATDTGGVSELVINNTTGILISPENEATLTEGMIKILEDVNFAESLAETGKCRVENYFSMQRWLDGLERIYGIITTPNS